MPKEITKVQEYEVQKGLKDGTHTEGKVVKIQKGKVSDFITNLKKWEGDIEQPAINLYIKSNTTSRDFHQLITLPSEDKAVNEKSNLYKFKIMNGDFPSKDQKVKLVVIDGWEKLLL